MADILPFTPPRATPAPSSSPPRVEPLWREVAGRVLRRRRHHREQTLAEVAARAGLSTQYLSEIERGVKEPSSEVLSAAAGALGMTLLDLTAEVCHDLVADDAGRARRRPTGPLALAA